ncbi:hypothetical protein NX059_003797 [Plenodomus lindquistii]|nr:hypothetical protein NX059_003797 [Plenodomus lindquistii]
MRNHIYSFALGCTDVTLKFPSISAVLDRDVDAESWKAFFFPAVDTVTSRSIRKTRKLRHPLALTKVNRQIREETHLLFFSLTRFHFWTLVSYEALIESVADSQRRAIRSLHFDVYWLYEDLYFEDVDERLSAEVPAEETYKMFIMKKWLRQMLGIFNGLEYMFVEGRYWENVRLPVIRYDKKKGGLDIYGEDVTI